MDNESKNSECSIEVFEGSANEKTCSLASSCCKGFGLAAVKKASCVSGVKIAKCVCRSRSYRANVLTNMNSLHFSNNIIIVQVFFNAFLLQ